MQLAVAALSLGERSIRWQRLEGRQTSAGVGDVQQIGGYHHDIDRVALMVKREDATT